MRHTQDPGKATVGTLGELQSQQAQVEPLDEERRG